MSEIPNDPLRPGFRVAVKGMMILFAVGAVGSIVFAVLGSDWKLVGLAAFHVFLFCQTSKLLKMD